MLPGRTTLFKLPQPLKAESPILPAPSLIVSRDRLPQFLNASSPVLFTLAGIVSLDRLPQL